jgi:hypothetical protein
MSKRFGTGRISEIIDYLKQKYQVTDVWALSPEQKLDTLCEALQLSHEQLDNVIADNPPVLRPIKGHVFEVIFWNLVSKSGNKVVEVGGDTDIDYIVNDKSLQLKSPYAAGTTENIVQYKTHKTHGPKSEDEALEYYHSVDDFADYLVGLISYVPFRVIFLHKSELPTHRRANNRIISPFSIEWENHPGLNAFDRIGIEDIELSPAIYLCSDPAKELLPKSAQALQVTTDVILNAIINESNFRVWDMSIRGFAREAYFQDYLASHNVRQLNPCQCRTLRGDKADLALVDKSSQRYCFLQIKGVSINNCKFDGYNSIVGVETQLTRGRVSDHPTQSRLYLTTDFDLLIVGIDPSLSQMYRAETGDKQSQMKWEFYAVPTDKLETHKRIMGRLKSLQKLNYAELQENIITDAWTATWQSISQS